MKKVIVFGGSGFLGSHVADELSSRSYEVLIADIKESKYINSNQQYVKCDIKELDSLKGVITEDVFAVYNFAGLADIDEAFIAPIDTVKENVLGNLHVLNWCKEKKVKRFIYASSVYACSKIGSFYGISKLLSEKLVEEYYNRYRLKYTIIRYGSLYGDRADKRNNIYNIIKQALEKKIINHHGNGNEIREYINAKDAAKLSVDIIEEKKYINEHIMLTGMEKIKQKDLLYMIKEIMNNEIEINFKKKNVTGHYEITPYSFHPNYAKKLVINPYIDMGQGLVECMKTIYDELQSDK